MIWDIFGWYTLVIVGLNILLAPLDVKELHNEPGWKVFKTILHLPILLYVIHVMF